VRLDGIRKVPNVRDDMGDTSMSIEGNLQEMNVADLIQHSCAEGRTIRITLQNNVEDITGIVFIDSGEIVHAELGSLKGEEAVYSLLSWEEGTFQRDPDVPAPEHTVHRSTTGVLLEGMRRIDEQANLQLMQGPNTHSPESGMGTLQDEPEDSPWDELIKLCMSTEGVEGTIIAAQDGIVIAHDIDANPDKEGAVIVYIGLAASQTEQVLEDCVFQWGRVKISQENILVIGRKDHYIGLFLDDRASPALVASQILEKLE
jgi:predicted regulator of Ras-like GTPase activity (Roadblock/LC7/MglB family)